MLDLLAKIIIDTGLQAVGWGVMKGVSLGSVAGVCAHCRPRPLIAHQRQRERNQRDHHRGNRNGH
jgi:hypothetical protein